MVSIDRVRPDRYFEKHALAGNGSFIRVYGDVKMNIKILDDLYSWNFLVANMPHCLLGFDFLKHFKFTYDFHLDRLCKVRNMINKRYSAKRDQNDDKYTVVTPL